VPNRVSGIHGTGSTYAQNNNEDHYVESQYHGSQPYFKEMIQK